MGVPEPLSVSLVGMPGGGKSTVGRHLARRLGLPFVDADAVIEQTLGCPIRTYFEQEGEDRFRDLEEAVLADLVAGPPRVIATGGGVVLREANRTRLATLTTCIYLQSTPEDLFHRVRNDAKRPLLQVADPLARLRELHAVRDPLYCLAARFVIPTGRPSVHALIATIVAQLGEAGLLDALRPPDAEPH